MKCMRRLLSLGAVILVAGCASSSGTAVASSSSAASSTPAAAASSTPAVSATSSICAQAAAVVTSLKKLEQVKVSKAEVSVLTADVKSTEASLTTLSNDATSEWTSQISGLKTALNHLQGTVTTLASKPSATAVASVATAVGGVKTAGTALVDKVKANCPNIA
jgi:hypothetical protein